ncbi:hypothetical protein C5167_049709 [Papaver somniferum]|uniref:DUF1685 domain-containing protein n=1 Tax=Papaver somniferum TaxID=3469 RepID=A0A4Y7KN10_PAPSO|nr:uncharacterized protein LOC113305819 [Papaver somniferum]RZC74237.1 hypothetical protein C5167_049709 [Papaver somniferum]
MDAEDVLTLLDHYWFNLEIITKKPISTHSKTPVSPHEIQTEPQKQEISRVPSRHIRSHSDQFTSKLNPVITDFDSPKSVLLSHRLQTILSGKRVSEVVEEEEEIEEPHFIVDMNNYNTKKKKNMMMGMGMRRRKNRGSSKSLSDLEFDELQGFMDLGFKFSEEDKNSLTLVSIVPGLQRFGKKDNGDNNTENHEGVLISRPYLSESWDALDKRRKPETARPPLINWKVPNLGNDIDMKDQLKFWAHTIASTVR